MIYFFHHYELPAILQQARIQQLLNQTPQNPPQQQQGPTPPPGPTPPGQTPGPTTSGPTPAPSPPGQSPSASPGSSETPPEQSNNVTSVSSSSQDSPATVTQNESSTPGSSTDLITTSAVDHRQNHSFLSTTVSNSLSQSFTSSSNSSVTMAANGANTLTTSSSHRPVTSPIISRSLSTATAELLQTARLTRPAANGGPRRAYAAIFGGGIQNSFGVRRRDDVSHSHSNSMQRQSPTTGETEEINGTLV